MRFDSRLRLIDRSSLSVDWRALGYERRVESGATNEDTRRAGPAALRWPVTQRTEHPLSQPPTQSESFAHFSPLTIEPISMRIPDACRFTGISRSSLYLLIARGEVEVVKLGAATLVLTASLRTLIEDRRSQQG